MRARSQARHVFRPRHRNPCWLPGTFGGCRERGRYLLVGLFVLFAAPPSQVRSQPTRPFVMATDQSENTYEGQWLRRTYEEAFKRLGVPIEVTTMPALRGSVMVDSGAADGQVLRAFAYADSHPEQVRVEEPIYDVVFGLWVSKPELSLRRLADLAATNWNGIYRRGVELCQRALSPLVPAERLSSISSEDIGLRMLLAGRVDFYCEIGASVQNALYAPEFKNVTSIRPLLTFGDPIPLYPYLNKRHAELGTRLAVVLRQMKAEGLIELFRQQVREALTRQ